MLSSGRCDIACPAGQLLYEQDSSFYGVNGQYCSPCLGVVQTNSACGSSCSTGLVDETGKQCVAACPNVVESPVQYCWTGYYEARQGDQDS